MNKTAFELFEQFVTSVHQKLPETPVRVRWTVKLFDIQYFFRRLEQVLGDTLERDLE